MAVKYWLETASLDTRDVYLVAHRTDLLLIYRPA